MISRAIRRPLGCMVRLVFYRPPHVRRSPQTLYESLRAAVAMYRAGAEGPWRQRANRLAQRLVSLQLKDGGFDTGYHYGSPYSIRPGEALACEQMATSSLIDGRAEMTAEAGSLVEAAARRAVGWIAANQTVAGSRRAVPYAPHSTRLPYIYNGSSFCAGAIGLYLGRFSQKGTGQKNKLHDLYDGLIRYVEAGFCRQRGCNGAFWPYFVPSTPGLGDEERRKVDYYHQALQVYEHCLAERARPHPLQSRLIREAADHLVWLHRKHGVIPYCNSDVYFGGLIHLWGLSAVIPALGWASKVHPDREADYKQTALDTLNWIVSHGWNGEHFEDILTPQGRQWSKSHRFQARSEAWVLNGLAQARLLWGLTDLDPIIEVSFRKLEAVNFSGIEKHGKRRARVFLERLEARNQSAEKRWKGNLVSGRREMC